MAFEDIPIDVLQTLLFSQFSIQEVGRCAHSNLALANQFWYQEAWSNITHLDLWDDIRSYAGIGANGALFLSFRPMLKNVKSIRIAEDSWKSDKDEGITRHIRNLISHCGMSLSSIEINGGKVEGMLTEKYLTKYGSRLSHLSVDGPSSDGLPAKYIELILRNCCNVESFSVRLPSDYDVIPSLVDNMTNLQQLTLMGEPTNSFSPHLTELQHLTKLVTPATPECIGEWTSQTSLLKVDADLEALKLRLPPKLHLSNLKQGNWSIFMPVKDTNILKHLVSKYGIRMTVGGSNWSGRLYTAVRSGNLELMSFLLTLPRSTKRTHKPAIYGSMLYEVLKECFFSRPEVWHCFLRYASTLPENERRAAGAKLITKFAGDLATLRPSYRAGIDADTQNVFFFNEGIAATSPAFFRSTMVGYVSENESLDFLRWLLNRGLNVKTTNPMPATKDWLYDHITPRVVELLEPATVGWLKFDDWPRPSLERFIAKCDPTQLHTLKEILSPLVGPDGSIQLSDDFKRGIMEKIVAVVKPGANLLAVLRALGIDPPISPATFPGTDIVTKLTLSGFLSRLVKHTPAVDEVLLGELLSSVATHHPGVDKSTWNPIISGLKKRKLTNAVATLSASLK